MCVWAGTTMSSINSAHTVYLGPMYGPCRMDQRINAPSSYRQFIQRTATDRCPFLETWGRPRVRVEGPFVTLARHLLIILAPARSPYQFVDQCIIIS